MIEIGEYVRTKKGEIMKVTSIPVEVDEKVTYQTDKGWVELECDIVKHSKNIIDVIEPSDLVNGLIVQSVHHFPDGKNSLIWVNDEFYTADNIRTILTHEQYEQNCYRLEG